MSQKLTKKFVDAAEPSPAHWDNEIRGFGLRVSPQGRKVYFLKYRIGPKQGMITIGTHGDPWTVDNARKKALEYKSLIAKGIDPKDAKPQSINFGEFAERYLVEHARPHKKHSSYEEDYRNLKNHIVPAMGQKKLRDIGARDVQSLLTKMKSNPYAANRCRALISKMFNLAEAWGERKRNTNPVDHVPKFEEKPRQRFLSEEETERLGKTLEEMEGTENFYAISAIRLLLLTGARLGEILNLRWEDIDLENRTIHIRDSKTGEKEIPLTAGAIGVLERIPRQESNAYVICGKVEGKPMVNLQKAWQRIRKKAELEDVRIHDLRHSFASVAASSGMSLPMIGALLGHSQPQTTARYAHLADRTKHEAASAVAERVSGALYGKNIKRRS